jgi:hypothetical protein
MGSAMLLGFKLVLLALCVLCFLRGGGPERTGAALLIAGFTGQRIIQLLGYPYNFDSPSMVHLVYSAILFAASLPLAIRSNRIWPVFFSALYLVQFTGHMAVAVLEEGRILAYWIMTQIPVIAQAGVLVWGTYTFLQRERRGIRASDWRLKVYP